MNKQNQFDVIVVGGGLAGLTSAIHLSIKAHKVLLIEKHAYPRHKVCGEYVSNEVLPYLNSLGINPFEHGAKNITQLEITTRQNKKVSAKLPLGGFGISRYCLDHALASQAKKKGVIIECETAEVIDYLDDHFYVKTKEGSGYEAKFVIGSYGKRSNLDKKLNRDFIQRKSPYLAVKMHVTGNFSEKKVALHNFKGGYCGVSKVESDAINLCYITDFSSFKKYKSISEFQEKVLFKNRELKDVFTNSKPVFKEPLTISQISFESKPLTENHILMCGDAAAMIHPLCGNGMGMAISGAQLLSNLLNQFFENKIQTREQLEKVYLTRWNRRFKTRLFFGHRIASIFRNNFASSLLWNVVRLFPFLIGMIIKRTHGKELKPI